jgi:hypothetical protein
VINEEVKLERKWYKKDIHEIINRPIRTGLDAFINTHFQQLWVTCQLATLIAEILLD